ncbi:hypothetical protein LBMAG27_11650 [Bacteroidota bacterium]|nr:hypothetical protein LBMAG27_11650 [Bacteroidota bacterium]
MDTVQESMEMLQKNVDALRNEIAILENYPLHKEEDIRNFHEKVKTVNNLFRGLNPLLKKEDSGELLTRFNSASARVLQFREELNKQKQQFIDSKKAVVKARITDAENKIEEHYSECISILKQVSDWLKEGKVDLKYAQTIYPEMNDIVLSVKLGLNDLDELWTLWKQVREKSDVGKKNIWDVNYNLCKSELMTIEDHAKNGDPYDATKAIMEMQRRLRDFKMSNEQSEEIKKTLNDLWEQANLRIKEKKDHFKEENKRKRDEFQQKKQEWLNKTKSAYERFSSLVAKNKEVIEKAAEQVSQLIDERDTARSDAYKNRIQVWIDEKETKINDIKKTNDELQAKIDNMKKELAKAKMIEKDDAPAVVKKEKAPEQISVEEQPAADSE